MKSRKSKASGRSNEPEKPKFHVFDNKGETGSKVEAKLNDARANGGFVIIEVHVGEDEAEVDRIMCDPTHPKNKWTIFMEKCFIDGVGYYRLVDRIPMAVKEAWEQTGKPPKVTLRWGPDTGGDSGKHAPKRSPEDKSGGGVGRETDEEQAQRLLEPTETESDTDTPENDVLA